MTKLQQLAQLGQSVWYDYIQRSLLESTDFKNLIRGGLRGITSNPSIFQKAISNTSDYDPALAAMKGKDINEIYEALVLKDIGQAADLFRPLFDATNGLDGYVSIEVNPLLAYDSQKTIEEAIRLFNKLARPNIMIKVPATNEGLPAVTELLSLGININVTLIFGLDQYLNVAEAFFIISPREMSARSLQWLHFLSAALTPLLMPVCKSWGTQRCQAELLLPIRKLLMPKRKSYIPNHVGKNWQGLARGRSVCCGPAPVRKIPPIQTRCMWTNSSER